MRTQPCHQHRRERIGEATNYFYCTIQCIMYRDFNVCLSVNCNYELQLVDCFIDLADLSRIVYCPPQMLFRTGRRVIRAACSTFAAVEGALLLLDTAVASVYGGQFWAAAISSPPGCAAARYTSKVCSPEAGLQVATAGATLVCLPDACSLPWWCRTEHCQCHWRAFRER